MAEKHGVDIGQTSAHQGWSRSHREYNDRLNKSIADIFDKLDSGEINESIAKNEILSLRDALRNDLLSGEIDLAPSIAAGSSVASIGPFFVVVPIMAKVEGGTYALDDSNANQVLEGLSSIDISSWGSTVAGIAYDCGKIVIDVTPIGDFTTIIIDGPKILVYSGDVLSASAEAYGNALDVRWKRKDWVAGEAGKIESGENVGDKIFHPGYSIKDSLGGDRN